MLSLTFSYFVQLFQKIGFVNEYAAYNYLINSSQQFIDLIKRITLFVII